MHCNQTLLFGIVACVLRLLSFVQVRPKVTWITMPKVFCTLGKKCLQPVTDGIKAQDVIRFKLLCDCGRACNTWPCIQVHKASCDGNKVEPFSLWSKEPGNASKTVNDWFMEAHGLVNKFATSQAEAVRI